MTDHKDDMTDDKDDMNRYGSDLITKPRISFTRKEGVLAVALIIAVVILSVVYLGAILTPFIAGFFLAYLLAPLVTRLEQLKLSPLQSILLVFSGFTIVFCGAILLIVPIIITEFISLLNKLPNILNRLIEQIMPLFEMLKPYMSTDLQSQISLVNLSEIADPKIIVGVLAKSFGVLSGVTQNVASGLNNVFGLLGLLLITPLVVVHVLLSRQAIVRSVFDLTPKPYQAVMEKLSQEIDQTLGAYARGVLVVMLILSGVYASVLLILGVPNGLIIGIISGFLIILPYIGSITGMIFAMTLCWFTFGFDWHIWVVGAVYITGNIVESLYLTPRFVGKSVGLNELWVIFALLAGGNLAGFLGVMLALPIAAVVAVIIKRVALTYRHSQFHAKGFD